MLVMYLSILNPLERNETKVRKSQQNEQKTLLLTGGRWGVGSTQTDTGDVLKKLLPYFIPLEASTKFVMSKSVSEILF